MRDAYLEGVMVRSGVECCRGRRILSIQKLQKRPAVVETLPRLEDHSQGSSYGAIQLFHLGPSVIAGSQLSRGEAAKLTSAVKAKRGFETLCPLSMATTLEVSNRDFLAGRNIPKGIYGLMLHLAVPAVPAVWTTRMIDEARRCIECAGG